MNLILSYLPLRWVAKDCQRIVLPVRIFAIFVQI